MKKIIITSTLSLLMALSFAGCSSNEPGTKAWCDKHQNMSLQEKRDLGADGLTAWIKYCAQNKYKDQEK